MFGKLIKSMISGSYLKKKLALKWNRYYVTYEGCILILPLPSELCELRSLPNPFEHSNINKIK